MLIQGLSSSLVVAGALALGLAWALGFDCGCFFSLPAEYYIVRYSLIYFVVALPADFALGFTTGFFAFVAFFFLRTPDRLDRRTGFGSSEADSETDSASETSSETSGAETDDCPDSDDICLHLGPSSQFKFFLFRQLFKKYLMKDRMSP